MAQEVQSKSAAASPLYDQIYQTAQEIKAGFPGDLFVPSKIAILNDQVFAYLAGIDSEDPRICFFSRELREHTLNLQDVSADVLQLAEKGMRAVRYLHSAEESPRGGFQPVAPSASPVESFAKVLDEGDRGVLRALARAPEKLDSDQRDSLLKWGVTNWDPIILNLLLKKCPFHPASLEPLVRHAFRAGVFETIAYTLFLFHYSVLTVGSKKRIEEWQGASSGDLYQGLASDLTALEEVLKQGLGIKSMDFVVIHQINSKKDLIPFIQRVQELFLGVPHEIVETLPTFQIASAFWGSFLDKWEKGAVPDLQEEIQQAVAVLKSVPTLTISFAEFEMRVAALLKSPDGVGAFRGCMDPVLMKRLLPQTGKDLLRWADENDDDELTCFLIRHDIIDAATLDSLVEAYLRENSFKTIAQEVTPYKLSRLSSQMRDRVLAWTMTTEAEAPLRRSSPGHDGADAFEEMVEEKFDPTALMNSLFEAIQQSEPALLRDRLGARGVSQLTEPDFAALIMRSLESPLCLAEVVKSPYLSFPEGVSMEILSAVLEKKNWDAMLLLVSPLMRRITKEAYFYLIDRLPNDLRPDVGDLIQAQSARFFDEPS